MRDFAAAAVINAVKVVRVMVFWIALFMADKIFQDMFVRRVLVEDGEPPDLRYLVPVALGIDFAVCAVIFTALVLVRRAYKKPGNTFVVDGALLRALAFDYGVSTAALLAAGVLLGDAVQNRRLLRYRDMGLRGIRAFCDLFLPIGAVLIAIPFYRLS